MTVRSRSRWLVWALVLAAGILPLWALSRRPERSEPPAGEGGERKNMFFYLDKLKDREYVRRDTDGVVWYTAAEELGLIGRDAIPPLMGKLDSQNAFERAQALYALKLVAQHEDVMIVTNGDQPDLSPETLPSPSRQPALIQEWKKWYATYGPRLGSSSSATPH